MTEQLLTADILPKLREWLDFNLAAGCTPEQLEATLRDAGYRQNDITGLLQAHLSRQPPQQQDPYDAASIAGPDEALQRFWQRLDVLNSFNQIALEGRMVRIAVKQVRHGIYLIPGFLSDEECRGLMLDETRMDDSMIVDESDGRSLISPDRSSRSAIIDRGSSELVRRIESRIAKLTAIPVSHGEALQVLRYGVGGEYRPHFDYFDPSTSGGSDQLKRGPQRLASLILYLSEVESGGATLFPELSLAFTPLKGAALLFASIGSDGVLLKTSLHAGCPVTSGEKWIATKWIRLMPYDTAANDNLAVESRPRRYP